jgi:hypothetical protein
MYKQKAVLIDPFGGISYLIRGSCAVGHGSSSRALETSFDQSSLMEDTHPIREPHDRTIL